MYRVLQFLKSDHNPFESLIRQEQKLHCNSIFSHLLNPNIKVNIGVKNTIKDLILVLLSNTIRARGRLEHAGLPLDAKTPFFLPNRSRLVDLITTHIHESHNHCGVSQTISLYRQQIWTPKLRCCVKSLLFRCVVGHRIRGKTIPKPLPPPLPEDCVKWKVPFMTVSVDHTGYFWHRDEYGKRKKIYICLFVCTTIRAIHFEPVTNLSTPSFLLCLRCLAAAKGAPSTILSDNHQTFLSGERFLLELQYDPQVEDYLANRRIE